MLPLPLGARFWSYAPFWSKPPLLVGNPDILLLIVSVSQYGFTEDGGEEEEVDAAKQEKIIAKGKWKDEG